MPARTPPGATSGPEGQTEGSPLSSKVSGSAASVFPSEFLPWRNEGGGKRSAEGESSGSLLGDPTLSAGSLAERSNLFIARHLMALMARPTSRPRDDVIKHAADLLFGLEDPSRVRKVLGALPDVAPIVDIYPLEVMTHMVDARPGYLGRIDWGPVVLNKAELEKRTFEVGTIAVLRMPLAARLRAFALEGGGSPGYALAPGPPARYLLEVHAPGSFSWLFRADVRREGRLDRLTLQIVE